VTRPRLIRVAVAAVVAVSVIVAVLSLAGLTTSNRSMAATATTNFQPTAPYYATFLYPWYRNVRTDGAYSYWHDHSNNPPKTWFGHYLPDPRPSCFSPSTELYSSLCYSTFRWQLRKMAQARIEVAITSWFGKGTKQDVAIAKYLGDFMKRSDNPYPNLRFALYYEDEGFADPSVSRLVSDLSYIQSKYASSPYFLKVHGKPVVFVYGGANDGTGTSRRWKQANAQLGNAFYYVLKVHQGYESDPNQPSSWHQYAPSSRYGSHGRYSAFVSPGFWWDAPGQRVRLARDLGAFRTAVTRMVRANVTWKLVETWNEWGEGSSVEPGRQTRINAAGREVLDTSCQRFGSAYVRALADRLPRLEAGTGS
jgi:hypothetical protein